MITGDYRCATGVLGGSDPGGGSQVRGGVCRGVWGCVGVCRGGSIETCRSPCHNGCEDGMVHT